MCPKHSAIANRKSEDATLDAPKVVGMYGGPVIDPRVPEEETIAALEALLERARAGEIQGIAAVVSYHDGAAGQHVCGHVVTSRILGEIQVMSGRITGLMLGN